MAFFTVSAGLEAATMLVYGPTAGCYADLTPGYTVTVWNAATWATKTTADFAAFDVIVFGDCPPCTLGTAPYAAAIANAPVWAAAITGNKIIMGSDPDWHSGSGGMPAIINLIHDMVNFAANDPLPGPGLYVALGCSYEAAPPTVVTLLSGFGTFVAEDSGCGDNVVKLASHTALASVTSASLSNWGCSVHEGFTSWPSGFQPLAMVVDAPTSPYTAPDGTHGLVYILASGSDVVSVFSPTRTATPAGPTATFVDSSTQTLTFSCSPTRTISATITLTSTQTTSFSSTATRTFSPTPTPTPTFSQTRTPSPTATATASSTSTPSNTASATPTSTKTITATFSISPTYSPSPTITPTFSISPTFSITKTPVDQSGEVEIRGLYPNPFSEQVHAVMVLKHDATVDIGVYNVAGEPVYSEKTPKLAGVNIWDWNGVNNSGARLASGVYVIRASCRDWGGQASYLVVAIAR